jgi:hypothetical protein
MATRHAELVEASRLADAYDLKGEILRFAQNDKGALRTTKAQG